MTQKEIIIKVLEDKTFWDDMKEGWVVSWKLIKNDTIYGFLGTSADRIARYMLDPNRPEYDPYVERKHDGKYAYYRISQKGQLQLIN